MSPLNGVFKSQPAAAFVIMDDIITLVKVMPRRGDKNSRITALRDLCTEPLPVVWPPDKHTVNGMLGMQDIYDGKNPEIIVCDSVEESNMTDNVRICVDDVTLGRQAVRHLLDMIDNKNCVVQEKLPVKLITAKEVQK